VTPVEVDLLEGGVLVVVHLLGEAIVPDDQHQRVALVLPVPPQLHLLFSWFLMNLLQDVPLVPLVDELRVGHLGPVVVHLGLGEHVHLRVVVVDHRAEPAGQKGLARASRPKDTDGETRVPHRVDPLRLGLSALSNSSIQSAWRPEIQETFALGVLFELLVDVFRVFLFKFFHFLFASSSEGSKLHSALLFIPLASWLSCLPFPFSFVLSLRPF
jgi:hypothetical protein